MLRQHQGDERLEQSYISHSNAHINGNNSYFFSIFKPKFLGVSERKLPSQLFACRNKLRNNGAFIYTLATSQARPDSLYMIVENWGVELGNEIHCRVEPGNEADWGVGNTADCGVELGNEADWVGWE